MSHKVEAVISERDVADYYLLHGLHRLKAMYKIKALGGINPLRQTYTRQAYQEWCNNMRSKFGSEVYIY